MRVLVSRSGDADTVRLVEPSDFARFSVVVDGVSPEQAGGVLRAAGAGAPAGDGDVLVSEDWLAARLAAAGVRGWEQSLDEMIAYARSRGWFSEQPRGVRAHVEAA